MLHPLKFFPEESVIASVGTETPVEEAAAVDETPVETTPAPIVDERAVQGKQLLDLLENPETAAQTVELLANRLGVKAVAQGQTPAAAKRSVMDVFRATLGKDFAQFADVLGPAVQAAIQHGVEEKLETVRNEVKMTREQVAQREVSSVVDNFKNDFKVSEDTFAKMNAQALKMPMGDAYNREMKSYLTDLHAIVKGSAKQGNAVAKVVDRINKNANEATPPPTEVNETRTQRGSKLPSLDEAISAAFKGEKI